jgi:hypothetical protein
MKMKYLYESFKKIIHIVFVKIIQEISHTHRKKKRQPSCISKFGVPMCYIINYIDTNQRDPISVYIFNVRA